MSSADLNAAIRNTLTVARHEYKYVADIESMLDSGGGIPEAIQRNIFDPFFTTKEVGKGTAQSLTIDRPLRPEHAHEETHSVR